MCRLPRQICLLLSLAMLSAATPQRGRPRLVDSRPPQEYEQSDPSEPDMRRLSHYLNARREDLADLFNDDATRGLDSPEQDRLDSSSHSADDLASLYKQLDLVTMVMDVLSGKYTPRSVEQEGIALPEGVLLPDEYQRPNQQSGQPLDYDIAELFQKMQQGDNLGTRLRRAANRARLHEQRDKFTLSDGKGGTNSGQEANCVPGKRAWPTCKLLTKYKIESFHVTPHEEEKSKDETRGEEEKHSEQGSVSNYGEGKKIEGVTDDDQGAEEEHSSAEKSGSRKKRESTNKEVWNDPFEGTGGGKRAPDFHSWGGKRAQQVDLNEIYNSDSSQWGDKRAPEFNSWGGKRSADGDNWGGKGALESSCRGGKRRTAFNNWGGKRGPSFNSWGGKRAPSFNSWGGKRAPEFNSWGGKRAPEFNSWGGKRSPSFNSWGGKRTPSFHSWGGKRAPEFNSLGGKRKPAFNSWGGKRSTWMLQKLLDNNTTPDIASATHDDIFDERSLGSARTKVGKRGTTDGIRAMIKAPNLPAIRSRSAGFYPWGGKRSDSSLLQ